MYRKVRLLVIAVCLLALAAGGAFSVQASTPSDSGETKTPKPAADNTVSIEAPKGEAEVLLAQWTQEARKAAKPLPFPAGAAGVSSSAEGPTGESGLAPGGKADPKADAMAQEQFPEEWAAPMEELIAEDESDVSAYGTAGVYTSYRANYYSQMWKYYPYYAVGKLYISGGGYCSASVISSHNIIVTAAHCVYDTDNNKWYNGWTFVPADRNGAAPYGTFPWTSARVLNNWINAASSGAGRRYDVALIRLGNNSAGHSVTYYTGYLGRSWNYGYVQHHHAIGYPSNLDSGKYTYICAAESFNGGTDILGMGCNMTYGSSGGPWIRTFKPYTSGANNYVNSVVSGGTPGTNTFYGARFSNNNIVPLCNAEGC